MTISSFLRRLTLVASLFLVMDRAAVGQAAPMAGRAGRSDSTAVYNYVQQMPQLPGGGGSAGILAAIRERVAPTSGCSGKVFASFVVGPSGVVKDARIIKGLGQSCDEATLAAIRKLPRFKPGRQGGQAVAVIFTVPVTF